MRSARRWAFLATGCCLGAVACEAQVVVKGHGTATATGTTTYTPTGTTTYTPTGTTTYTPTGTTTYTATGTGTGLTPSCYDESWALLLPGDDVATYQARCTIDEIDGLYDGCLSDTANEQTCEAFMNAHPDCLDCIVSDFLETGPIPVLAVGDIDLYLTTYGCEAAAHDMPECAWPVQAYVFCVETACAECAAGSSEADACRDVAGDGICSELGEAISPECEAVFTFAGSPECSGSDWQQTYRNVASYYCGPPT